MAQTFTLQKTAVNRWTDTCKNPDPSAFKARCSAETVSDALAPFPNVSLVSARFEGAKPDRPEAFHIVLREEGYGATPATINIYCPTDWNGRFLGCTGGGVRTLHIYEVLGRENRIVMPFNAIANGFATANTDGGVPGEVFYFSKRIPAPLHDAGRRTHRSGSARFEPDHGGGHDRPDEMGGKRGGSGSPGRHLVRL